MVVGDEGYWFMMLVLLMLSYSVGAHGVGAAAGLSSYSHSCPNRGRRRGRDRCTSCCEKNLAISIIRNFSSLKYKPDIGWSLD